MSNTERESVTICCGCCGQLAPMRTDAAYSHTVEHEIEDVGFYLERFVLRLSVCPVCQSVNLTAEDDDGRLRVWCVPLNARLGDRSRQPHYAGPHLSGLTGGDQGLREVVNKF